MDIIKTDRSNVRYFIGVGVVCLLFILYILVGVFKEESSPKVLVFFSLTLGIMIHRSLANLVRFISQERLHTDRLKRHHY